MKITVNLYGAFRRGFAEHRFVREFPDGTRVQGLFESLGLPPTMYKMMLVNGFRVKDDKRLADGDEVHIFQPVGGG